MEQHQTFCRYCHAYCAMVATVDGGVVRSVKPDTTNPIYGGYTCIKGRQLVEQMYQSARLVKPLKKNAHGEFEEVTSQQALDEIADKVKQILDESGPRAIATYNGTVAFQNSAQLAYSKGWHDAIGSVSYYTSVTIDQPAKVFVGSRMGYWAAGSHFFHDSDVALIIGNNPLVSHYAPPGSVPSMSPAAQLRKAKQRGLKLIVVDPRETELARRADLFLQIQPGQDASLVAGMIRLILEEGLHDEAFCSEFVEGLETLQSEVAEFTPERVEALTGIPATQVIEAARTFAVGPRGCAVTGTGPEMSSHPNLTHHLVGSLNAICGRFDRAGDQIPNPGVLSRPSPRFAQALNVPTAWGRGAQCRARPEFGELKSPGRFGLQGEMPTSQLADEILLEGEGQVRALFVIAGNPILAWPDQEKTLRAMQKLDLLVCIDPYMAATAELAHYVLPPKLTLEREDVTLLSDPWYEKPYSQYSKAVVQTDHDVIEEWELYSGIARRLNIEVRLGDEVLPSAPEPTKFQLLKAITKGSRVDIEYLRAHPGGHVFSDQTVEVQPAQDGAEGRLQLYPEGVAEEFAALRADHASASDADGDFSHLLIGYRSKYVLNSFGLNLPAIKAKQGTTNPALIHPEDLAALGIEDDSEVVVESAFGAIPAVVKATDRIKRGVVAMHHSWGAAPNRNVSVREVGSNTNLLVSSESQLQAFTGMPKASGIPIRIRC